MNNPGQERALRILGIDTATSFGSAGLVEAGRVVAEQSWEVVSGHAQRLAPVIRELCDAVGWKPASLDAVAVSIGPGSFTGLRVGLGLAKGLAFAASLAVVPVSTLEALAAVADAEPGELVCPVLDARKGELYVALYDVPERGHLRLLWGPTLARPEQVAERVTSRCRFVGDAVALHGDQIEAALGREALLLPFSRYHPAGGTVALQGMRALAAGRAVPIGAVEPCYVRSAWAQIHRAQEIESSLTTKGAV
jgi:tRNA threonylcarbamoyladenosine biosynthesis protein TsaB